MSIYKYHILYGVAWVNIVDRGGAEVNNAFQGVMI